MRRKSLYAVSSLLLMLSLVICSGPAAAKPAEKSKPTKIKLTAYLSTGEEFSGLLISNTARSISVKGKKKYKFSKANIIALDLHLSGEDQAKLDKHKGSARHMAVGDWLLKNSYPDLAARAFSAALRSNKKLQGEVAKIYTKQGKQMPDKLDGNYGGLDKKGRRYILPRLSEVKFATTSAEKLGKDMKKINSQTHLIETDNFHIYSSWPKSDDRKLKQIYTKLYQALCKQFNIPKGENIWVGKLPVYAFWQERDFKRFCVESLGYSAAVAENAGGFYARHGYAGKMLRFVVLGPVKRPHMKKSQAKTWFYELLVHESSHAFMSRFVSDKRIPNWVNEGIAETMASTFVPKSRASIIVERSSKAAVSTNRPIDGIFDCDNIPLDLYHYGLAQSVVRYLIKKDRKKFIQFVMLLKEGQSDKKALKSAYGMSREAMKKKWRRYAKKKYR